MVGPREGVPEPMASPAESHGRTESHAMLATSSPVGWELAGEQANRSLGQHPTPTRSPRGSLSRATFPTWETYMTLGTMITMTTTHPQSQKNQQSG